MAHGPLIDSHLLSGYNLCWNHFEKLYLDLILHIVKPYIQEVGGLGFLEMADESPCIVLSKGEEGGRG